jgi:hypothetical protein
VGWGWCGGVEVFVVGSVFYYPFAFL